MNLFTHIFFAGLIAAIFSGNPYFALLAGVGAFIPDLDREYLLISRKTFRDQQLHRALFHNLLFLIGLFFVNVWLCLGAFLHCFLDTFSTEKDRGVEWLYPFSRMVKTSRYALSAESTVNGCKILLVDQNPQEPVSFILKDTPALSLLSDSDLKQHRVVPRRRTYGPATNGQLFDRWLALASFSGLMIYTALNPNFGYGGLDLILSTRIVGPMVLLSGIVAIFIGGWAKKNKKLAQKYYLILFGVGVSLMVASAALSITGLSGYVFPINPLFAGLAAIVLFVEAFAVLRFSTRKGKKVLV